jgi:polyhydroxyalkanoate synthesis repressor PhaR
MKINLPHDNKKKLRGFAMTEPVELKKYANRRLYDTEKSAYVTLSELADLVRSGRQVLVRDAQTKEDVTAFILTQVILEEAKNKNALLPAPLLHLIIQFGDNQLVEFFQTYLLQIVQAYLAQRAAFDEQFKRWIGSGMDLSEMARRHWSDMGGMKTILDLNPFLKSSPPAQEDKGPAEDKK